MAVGVVYANGLFMSHMWTEAYLDDWTALDATLCGGDVVDATHIKLAVSPMDGPTPDDAALIVEAQAQQKLKINVLEFKAKPAQEALLPPPNAADTESRRRVREGREPPSRLENFG